MFEMYEKNIQNASFTVTSTSSRSQDQLKLSLLTTDLLTIIIKNNTENGKLFTECFGAKLLIEIVCGRFFFRKINLNTFFSGINRKNLIILNFEK